MAFDDYDDLIKSISNPHELIGILPISKLDFSARYGKRFLYRILSGLLTGIVILLASFILQIIPLGVGIFPIIVVWIFWNPKPINVIARALIINKDSLKVVQITPTGNENSGLMIYNTFDTDFSDKKKSDFFKFSITPDNKLKPDFWVMIEGRFVKATIDFYNGKVSTAKFNYRVMSEDVILSQINLI